MYFDPWIDQTIKAKNIQEKGKTGSELFKPNHERKRFNQYMLFFVRARKRNLSSGMNNTMFYGRTNLPFNEWQQPCV